MPQITLTDNSKRSYDQPISIDEVARDIGSGLAKATVAGKINGKLVDASETITEDCKLQIVTIEDNEGLEIVRHSCAHLFAHALKQIYPDAQMAIGPVIKDGFYYDIKLERSLTDEDLKKIEARMKKLAKTKYDVVREVVSKKKAIDTFKKRNEPYKVNLAEEIPATESGPFSLVILFNSFLIKLYASSHEASSNFPFLLIKGVFNLSGWS